MSTEERPPSPDELLAMAYVDGELEPAARQAFEARLASEPALLREVAALRELELLARNAVAAEPLDFAWKRLERELLQRAGWRVGWTVLSIAVLGILGLGLWSVLQAELSPLAKALILGLLGSLLLLFALTLRARLRTLPYDPYKEIQR